MISQDFHAGRRKAVIDLMEDSSVLLLSSAPVKSRSRDTNHAFRQSSHFYYLSGFNEPNAVILIEKKQTGECLSVLFCQESDEEQVIWDGPTIGCQAAMAVYGFDQAENIDQFPEVLKKFLEDKQHVYCDLFNDSNLFQLLAKSVQSVRRLARKGVLAPEAFFDSNRLIEPLRMIKTKEEIVLMRHACDISVQAHVQVMKSCRSSDSEKQLEHVFLSHCISKGTEQLAYPSIVASGANACILHYEHNDHTLNQDDLLLIDAGCEWQYYASDITRTYPVNGKFNPHQKQLYEAVLHVQQKIIEAAAPGKTWHDINELTYLLITEALIDLNIIDKNDQTIEQLVEDKAYKPYYMHSVGHWLGLDVHDVGDYRYQGNWTQFKPGMLLTIEPGIYIREAVLADSPFTNMGVRIEDDILITEQGCEVLTAGCPKLVDDIESLMSHV